MKIIFSGTPLFAKKLTKHLRDNDKKNKYFYIDIKGGIFQRMKFYYHMLSADILHVTYVDAYFIQSVDFALKLNKKVILSWIGTDVLNAIPRIKEKKFNQKYIDKVTHVTASEWLKEELSQVGIEAIYLPNIIIENTTKDIGINLNDSFKILTRIAKNREKFYGIDTIIKLAIDFPDIEFRIAGIDNYQNIPNNVKLLGWVNMVKEYKYCTIFVRYMEHDGESHSVLEALSYGKMVFYNYDYPFVNYTPTYSVLKHKLQETIQKHNNKVLKPNYDGIKHIKENYNLDKVKQAYITLFHSLYQRQ